MSYIKTGFLAETPKPGIPPITGKEKVRRRWVGIFRIFFLTLLLVLLILPIADDSHWFSGYNVARRTRITILRHLDYLEKNYRNNPVHSKEIISQALALLHQNPAPALESRIHLYLCRILIRKGLYAEAETAGQKALTLAKKNNESLLAADIMSWIAYIRIGEGRYDQAAAILYSVKEILENYPQGILERGRVHNFLGIVCWRGMQLDAALEHFILAEQYYRRCNYIIGLGSTTNNIGNISLEIANYSNALDYYRKAEAYYRKSGELSELKIIYLNIGLIHAARSERRTAIDMFKHSMALAESFGDLPHIALSLNNMAEIYMSLKDHAQAASCLKRSLELWLKTGDMRGIAETHLAIGENLAAENRLGDAEYEIRKTLEIIRRRRYKREENLGLQSLFRVLNQQGRYVEALTVYKQYLDLSGALLSGEMQQRINGAVIRYKAESQSREIRLLNSSHMAKNIELIRRKTATWLHLVASTLTLLITIFIYALYRYKRRLNRSLEEEIKARLQTAERLRESEAMFRTLAEQTPLGVFIAQDQKIKYINPALSGISGLNVSETVGLPIQILFNHLQNADESDKWEIFDNGTFPPFLTVQSVYDMGEERYLEIYCVEITYEDRLAWLGAVADVTESYKRRRMIWAEQEHKSITRLASGMAHDFNNLLAVVSGYLHLVLDEWLDPRSPGAAKTQRAVEAADQAAGLIKMVLKKAGFPPDAEHSSSQDPPFHSPEG